MLPPNELLVARGEYRYTITGWLLLDAENITGFSLREMQQCLGAEGFSDKNHPKPIWLFRKRN